MQRNVRLVIFCHVDVHTTPSILFNPKCDNTHKKNVSLSYEPVSTCSCSYICFHLRNRNMYHVSIEL